MSSLTLRLASTSPRRRELLGRLTSDFEVVAPVGVDETPQPGEDPDTYVRRMALEKAMSIATDEAVTIAADTIVVLDGEILGKPTDRADAAATLTRLSGRAHEVLTAVAVIVARPDQDTTRQVAVARTEVHLAELTPARIDAYVATGEADDKAGSYGLQGTAAVFADDVHGSVTNVIGLPLPLLDRMCRDAGVDLVAWRA